MKRCKRLNIAKWIRRVGNRDYLNLSQIGKDTNGDFTDALNDNGLISGRIKRAKAARETNIFYLYVLVDRNWHSFTFNAETHEVWYGRQTSQGWRMVIGYRDTDGT